MTGHDAHGRCRPCHYRGYRHRTHGFAAVELSSVLCVRAALSLVVVMFSSLLLFGPPLLSPCPLWVHLILPGTEAALLLRGLSRWKDVRADTTTIPPLRLSVLPNFHVHHVRCAHYGTCGVGGEDAQLKVVYCVKVGKWPTPKPQVALIPELWLLLPQLDLVPEHGRRLVRQRARCRSCPVAHIHWSGS